MILTQKDFNGRIESAREIAKKNKLDAIMDFASSRTKITLAAGISTMLVSFILMSIGA